MRSKNIKIKMCESINVEMKLSHQSRNFLFLKFLGNYFKGNNGKHHCITVDVERMKW